MSPSRITFAIFAAAALAIATPAQAVQLSADIGASQISGDTIIIPLPDFTFDGSDDSINVLFTEMEHLKATVPGGGSSPGIFPQITGTTNAAGDGTVHMGGSVYLSDMNGDPLPDSTGDAFHADGNGGIVFFISGTIFANEDDMFTFHDVHFTASQAFDAGDVTDAVLSIVVDNGEIGPSPGRIEVGVWVPEPSSLVLCWLLASAWIYTTRHRRCRRSAPILL